MTATNRQTLPSELIADVEDGVAPPWRCQECVKKDQYAVQRVLEVVRGEDGKFYLLLEYLGYRYLEVRLESDSWTGTLNSSGLTENTPTHDPASACSIAQGPFWMPCGMGNR
jgi:hypothetical protein